MKWNHGCYCGSSVHVCLIAKIKLVGQIDGWKYVIYHFYQLKLFVISDD